MPTTSSELTERWAATLGHVYESGKRRRCTIGHHPKKVKEELVAAGLLEEVGWRSPYGPIFGVTELGCSVYEAHLATQAQTPMEPE